MESITSQPPAPAPPAPTNAPVHRDDDYRKRILQSELSFIWIR